MAPKGTLGDTLDAPLINFGQARILGQNQFPQREAKIIAPHGAPLELGTRFPGTPF